MGLSIALKQELVKLGLAASAGSMYLLWQGPFVRFTKNCKAHGILGIFNNGPEEPGFLK